MLYGDTREESEFRWGLTKPTFINDDAALLLDGPVLDNTIVGDSRAGGVYTVIAGATRPYSQLSVSVGFAGFEFEASVGLQDLEDFRAADINGDGLSDITAIKETHNGTALVRTLEVWLGDNTGRYELSSTLLFGETNLTVGDVNDDDLPDILSTDTEFLYIAIQNQDGTFTGATKQAINPNGCPLSENNDLAIGNNDSDEFRDIFLSRSCLGRVEVWQQSSFGDFDNILEYDYENQYGGGSFGDLNGDELTDIALGSRSNSDGAAVALNNGAGFSVSQAFDPAGRSGQQMMLVADATGDGVPEFIQKVGRELIIYQRNSDEAFVELTKINYDNNISFSFLNGGKVSDVDSDGDIDLIYSSTTGVLIFVNESGGYQLFSRKGSGKILDVFDYNQDGINDIILGGSTPFVTSNVVTTFSIDNK
jgi:hypothetical protein